MERPLETQQSWNWPIAAYLFLAGLGAGSTLVGVVYHFLVRSSAPVAKVGLAMGPPLALVGSFFLLFDLGRPFSSYLTPRGFSHSWISRGGVTLSVFIVIGIVHIALSIWPWQLIGEESLMWDILGVINGIFALLTATYTGLLLGCSPIPFWNTPILPVLFVVSSISTGTAAIVLVMIYCLGAGLPSFDGSLLLRGHGALTVIEMLLIGLYIYGMKLVTAARASVDLIVRGSLARLFWIGLVLFGLIVPLLGVYLANGIGFPLLCALFGGYLLRHIVVKAGIKMPLSAQGVIIPIPGKN